MLIDDCELPTQNSADIDVAGVWLEALIVAQDLQSYLSVQMLWYDEAVHLRCIKLQGILLKSSWNHYADIRMHQTSSFIELIIKVWIIKLGLVAAIKNRAEAIIHADNVF